MTRYSIFGLVVVGILLTGTASADDARDEAVRQYHRQIEGTWRVTALSIGGTKSKEEDTRKIAVVNGNDGTWTVRSEGKVISRGKSTVDPTKTPAMINFTPTEGGGKGEQFPGIYELSTNTRKLCFAPADKERPTEFSSTSENQHILVIFERMKPD